MTDTCIGVKKSSDWYGDENNHDFKSVKKTWQTLERSCSSTGDFAAKLDHSKEVMVCSKCGKVIDPWLTEQEQK